MIVNHNVVNAEKRKPLIDLGKTRWDEWHSAYQNFYQGYVFVFEALEMIAFHHHLEKYGLLMLTGTIEAAMNHTKSWLVLLPLSSLLSW